MKQMNKEWIYLAISVIGGLSIGIILGVLREIVGKI